MVLVSGLRPFDRYMMYTDIDLEYYTHNSSTYILEPFWEKKSFEEFQNIIPCKLVTPRAGSMLTPGA